MIGMLGETLVMAWGLAMATRTPEPLEESDEAPIRPEMASGSAETMPGAQVGTPGYMSPDQAAELIERLSPASDVYSLGATLYCLLAGQSPFVGADLGTVFLRVQRGDFPP